MAGLTSAKRWQLRRIFLQKKETYSPTEAARVLGMPRRSIVEMIERHALDAEKEVTTTYTLPWVSIASYAMERYTVADLIEALGKSAAGIVPPLLYPSKPVEVTLPLYLAKYVEHLAARQRMSVDEIVADVLRTHLDNIVGVTSGELDEAIPGFNVAYIFPDEREA
jgi:hypothetical protein